MSRGLIGEPWYNDTLRAAIGQHIEDNSNRYRNFIVGNIEDYLSKSVEMEFRVEIVKFKHLVRFTV